MFSKKVRKELLSQQDRTIIDKDAPFKYIEGYRSLRANLGLFVFDEDIKTILITSTQIGEGKSTVSINLATVFAMSGKKVLLIDADLRSPSVHKHLKIRKKIVNGLSSVVMGHIGIKEAIFKYKPLDIDIMFAGPIPSNAAELLERAETRKVIAKVREHYDMVIIDSPPTGVVADSVVLSNHVDGILYVVKQKYVDKKMTHDALRTLSGSYARILGVVLNSYSGSNNDKKYSSYEYGYGYGYGGNVPK